MNYNEALTKFQQLNIDTAHLVELQASVLDLDAALVKGRRELVTLRPNTANFRAELTRLSGLINALQSAVAGAKDDVADEIERLKDVALEAGAPQLPQVVTRIRNLDKHAVTLLLDLRETLLQRDTATTEADSAFGILAEFARERALDPGGVSWNLPWGDPWRGPGKALEEWPRRFASMVNAGPPGEGEDPLTWFSKRRW